MIVVIAAGILSGMFFYGQSGSYVEIFSNGKLYGEYSLSEEKTIVIESEYGQNTVKISNREVWVSDASCKDKLDVSQGKISRPGQSIICLPNRLIVTVKGGESVDALSY